MRVLVDESGRVAKIGDIFWDFRHENRYILERIDEPSKPSSTGRVQCKMVTSPIPAAGELTNREFYPGVLGLHWETVKEGD